MNQSENNPPALPGSIMLDCKRCAHVWVRRDLANLPKQCPRCHSPYFQTVRRLAKKVDANRK